MSQSNRPRRDAGSRGILDSIRHPIVAFSAPFRAGAPATEADQASASSPDGIVVSCFAHASFDPFPRSFKQGHLLLAERGVSWTRGVYAMPGEGTPLTPPIRVGTVREVEGAEKLRVKAHFFQIIEIATEKGDLVLGVPKDSVALVLGRLQAGLATP